MKVGEFLFCSGWPGAIAKRISRYASPVRLSASCRLYLPPQATAGYRLYRGYLLTTYTVLTKITTY